MQALPRAKVELPFQHWPETDRQAWEALFAGGDVFEAAGGGLHWADATRKTNHHHYARWLGWLSTAGALEADAQPWDRATPEQVRRYGKHLIEFVAPRTVASALIGLKVVLMAMRPGEDWRWLMDLTNRLNSWAEPSIDRTAQTVPIERIHNACLRELDRLRATPMARRIDRVGYRDTLIVLLLSCVPLRMRNLTMIEIGAHLRFGADGATLRFGEHETKNRQRLTHPLPRHVLPYLQHYLAAVRQSFGPSGDCRRLWLGFEGGPLTAHSIYGRILLVTDRLLGVKINPHSFRACAATSLADRSSSDALMAAPLLGHRYFSTTERHYIRAQQTEASRKVHAILADILRDSCR